MKEEEWLVEGDGDHANMTEFIGRFYDINSKLTQFKNRKNEY